MRARLLVAQRDGERFDRDSGLPTSWQAEPEGRRLHEWVREWLQEQWPEWQPRTRNSAVEALSRFVPAVHAVSAAPQPPRMREHLVRALRPDVSIDPSDPCERWMMQWSPHLANLDREMMARAERKLVTGLRGQQLGPRVAHRYRTVAHACIVRAVDLGVIDADPWPPPPRGRRTRKATRTRRSIDVRLLPHPATMVATIKAMRSHQPGSRTYQVMTAVAYYAGLRPSEIVMLRPQALDLPDEGWGQLAVVEADIDWDEPGEPKTGRRTVPIPPRLVDTLRSWIDERRIGGEDLLFRTRGGQRPSQSNWSRALKRACAKVGRPPLRVYDCRHAAATTWLRAGVPLGVVAIRLGHSVETLVSTYVGALHGDDIIANRRIEQVLEGAPNDESAEPATADPASDGHQRRVT